MSDKDTESTLQKAPLWYKPIAWTRNWLPRLRGIWLFLAVLGPGIITSSVDNDAGGIATYSICGARYGYSLLWSLLPITIALMVIQEMCTRMGVVTGKGLSDLIRERFGVRLTFYLLIGMLIGNLGNVLAEFAGVAASMELVGVSKYISVPIAGVAVWLLVIKVSHKRVEKVFLLACLLYAFYIISAFLSQPDWGEVLTSVARPRIEWGSGYFVMLVGVIGTTISPWMQFYLQSAVVEKGIKVDYLKFSRLDTVLGSFIVNIIAFFIIVVCAATIFVAGLPIETVKDAAVALKPLAGDYASLLYSFGLLNASLFAASILPLSTAFIICEGFGWETGVDKKFNQAPQFYTLYSLLILFGVLFILIPNLPLLDIMFTTQVINGILLPVILVVMLVLINDRRIMGDYVNSTKANIASYITVGAVIAITLTMVVLALMGTG